MELKPHNAKDKICTGKLFFSLELMIPIAMVDGRTDYFALMRRHAPPPTPIALAAVMVEADDEDEGADSPTATYQKSVF